MKGRNLVSNATSLLLGNALKFMGTLLLEEAILEKLSPMYCWGRWSRHGQCSHENNSHEEWDTSHFHMWEIEAKSRRLLSEKRQLISSLNHIIMKSFVFYILHHILCGVFLSFLKQFLLICFHCAWLPVCVQVYNIHDGLLQRPKRGIWPFARRAIGSFEPPYGC